MAVGALDAHMGAVGASVAPGILTRHFLVSLGSALIMIVSQYGFQEIIKENSVTLDPSRVAAHEG